MLLAHIFRHKFELHIITDMVVTVLCNYVLFLLQKFKSLVDIFESKLFFSSTITTLLVLFLVVLLLSKWKDFSNGTTNAGIEHSALDETRKLLLLALPVFSICRSMIFHTKSTEPTACILRTAKLGPKLIDRPPLVSSKKKKK